MKKILKGEWVSLKKNYQMMVDRKNVSRTKRKSFGFNYPTLSYEDLAKVDIVVEAVYENLELKQEIFKTLDSVTNNNAILASNTWLRY